jgi:hypothetical protein
MGVRERSLYPGAYNSLLSTLQHVCPVPGYHTQKQSMGWTTAATVILQTSRGAAPEILLVKGVIGGE